MLNLRRKICTSTEIKSNRQKQTKYHEKDITYGDSDCHSNVLPPQTLCTRSLRLTIAASVPLSALTTITHRYDEDKMDPVFTAKFTKMNDTYRQHVLSEMQALHGGPQAWMQSVQPALTLMEQVIDMSESPAAKGVDTVHFTFGDTQFKIEKGD